MEFSGNFQNFLINHVGEKGIIDYGALPFGNYRYFWIKQQILKDKFTN